MSLRRVGLFLILWAFTGLANASEERIQDQISVNEARMDPEHRAWMKGEIKLLNEIINELLPQSPLPCKIVFRTVPEIYLPMCERTRRNGIVAYLPVEMGASYLPLSSLHGAIDALVRARLVSTRAYSRTESPYTPLWFRYAVMHRFWARYDQVTPIALRTAEKGSWYIPLDARVVRPRFAIRAVPFPLTARFLNRDLPLPSVETILNMNASPEPTPWYTFHEECCDLILSYHESAGAKPFADSLRIFLCKGNEGAQYPQKYYDELLAPLVPRKLYGATLPFEDFRRTHVFSQVFHATNTHILEDYFSTIRENLPVDLKMVSGEVTDSRLIQSSKLRITQLSEAYPYIIAPEKVKNYIVTRLLTLMSQSPFYLRPRLTDMIREINNLNAENADTFNARWEKCEKACLTAFERDKRIQTYLDNVQTRARTPTQLLEDYAPIWEAPFHPYAQVKSYSPWFQQVEKIYNVLGTE